MDVEGRRRGAAGRVLEFVFAAVMGGAAGDLASSIATGLPVATGAIAADLPILMPLRLCLFVGVAWLVGSRIAWGLRRTG